MTVYMFSIIVFLSYFTSFGDMTTKNIINSYAKKNNCQLNSYVHLISINDRIFYDVALFALRWQLSVIFRERSNWLSIISRFRQASFRAAFLGTVRRKADAEGLFPTLSAKNISGSRTPKKKMAFARVNMFRATSRSYVAVVCEI